MDSSTLDQPGQIDACGLPGSVLCFNISLGFEARPRLKDYSIFRSERTNSDIR